MVSWKSNPTLPSYRVGSLPFYLVLFWLYEHSIIVHTIVSSNLGSIEVLVANFLNKKQCRLSEFSPSSKILKFTPWIWELIVRKVCFRLCFLPRNKSCRLDSLRQPIWNKIWLACSPAHMFRSLGCRFSVIKIVLPTWTCWENWIKLRKCFKCFHAIILAAERGGSTFLVVK